MQGAFCYPFCSVKILVVHNDYGKYSGEEAVVDRFIADARQEGHVVETLRRTSREARESLWGRIHGFFAGIYCLQGVRMMRTALRKFQPDVVNVHNLYPFISPAALQECKKAGVPVIMTVHNYRLICPTGLFLLHGQPCEECLARGNENPCVRHNCEHSLLRSVGYALRNRNARKRRYYLDNVDCYCCLTHFQRSKLMEAGFDAKKLVVIPNYAELSPPATAAAKSGEDGKAKDERQQDEEGINQANLKGGETDVHTIIKNEEESNQTKTEGESNRVKTEEESNRAKTEAADSPQAAQGYVAYVGRLSYEKGYDLLLQVAARHPEIPFNMAGEQREALRTLPSANVELCGVLPPTTLRQFYRDAALIVIPSRCYEGFPVVLLEAFAASKPCIVPNHGAFPQLIDDDGKPCGLTFAPNSPDDLEKKILQLLQSPADLLAMGRNARCNMQNNYSREHVLSAWQRLLQQTQEKRRKKS